MSNSMCMCVIPADISTNNINGLAVSAIDFFTTDTGDKSAIYEITKKDTQSTCAGVLQNVTSITESDYTEHNGELFLLIPIAIPGTIATVKVCNSEDINKGDLLCISHIHGILQKQNDNIVHNYTIAKSLEDSTFFMDNDFFFQYTNPRNIVITQYTTFSYETQQYVVYNDLDDSEITTKLLIITLDGNINIRFHDYMVDENSPLESINNHQPIEITEATFMECSNESHFMHEATNAGSIYVDNIKIDLSYDQGNSNLADIPHPCNLVTFNSPEYGEYKMRIAQIQVLLL